MATSSSSDFNRTRDQIIARAGRIIGAFKAGETMGAQEVTDFSEALNAMVKRWSATPGMLTWAMSEATLFPQAAQSQYAVAVNGADHCTLSYYATTISSTEAGGQTVLSVTATTGMTVADYIGVVLDTGSMQWSTISSKTSNTVTIADALTSQAAAGNAVFSYTTKIPRPMRLLDKPGAVRRYDIASGIEIPIGPPMARSDYQMLTNKSQSGIVNRVFYDPQLSTGYLYLWSPPRTVTSLVKFTFQRPIQDFDAAADNPDLPQEWIDPLVWNLADVLAMEYDVPAERADRISVRAAKYLSDVSGPDREPEMPNQAVPVAERAVAPTSVATSPRIASVRRVMSGVAAVTGPTAADGGQRGNV